MAIPSLIGLGCADRQGHGDGLVDAVLRKGANQFGR
jgi:hypothetical protein